DYTPSGTSIVIPPGSTSGSITLTAVQDALDEVDETIVVDISSVTNGTEPGTQQVTATIIDDDGPTISIGNVTVTEGKPGLTVNLSNPVHATIATGTGTGTILDDDNPPTVAFSLASSSGAESVSPANLAVALSTVSGKTVTVDYAVTGGTATGGGVDYTLAS